MALWTVAPKPKGKQCIRFYETSRGKLLNGNEFQVSRDLVDYFARFGPHFQKLIRDLGASDLWVDLGAGHGYAQKDWIAFHANTVYTAPADWNHNGVIPNTMIHHWWPHYRPNPAQLPQMKSVGFVKPENYLEISHPQFQYLEMDISSKSLKTALSQKKARVMTDYFGDLSYTETFSQDLKKYVEELTEDGSLFISIDNQANGVKTSSGYVPIVTWLSRQPGLVVHEIWTKEKIEARPQLEAEGFFWDGDSIEIKVTDLAAFLKSTNLKLVEYKSDGRGQPNRIFEE